MRSIVYSALAVCGCVWALTAVGCEEPQRAEPVPPPAKVEKSVTAVAPVAPVTPGSKDKKSAPVVVDTPPAAKSASAPAKAIVPDKNKKLGTVADTKFTGDYTYVRITIKDQKDDLWVAAAQYRGDIGDKVYLPDTKKELLMTNFYSKAFDFTFKEIYFVRDLFRPGEQEAMARAKAAPKPSSMPSSAASAASRRKILKAQAEAEGLPGKVLEVLQVDEYTYLRVDTGFKEAWVASTKVGAVVGDKIYVKDGILMNKFHSKTLDRTFDEIYFANAVVAKKAKAPTKAPTP